MRSWLSILTLALGPAVSNGFARFGYALILPAMKEDLSWSYTEAGWINTINALGYLIGALLALYLSNKVSSSRLFIVGMIITTLALLGSSLTDDFFLLSMMRLIAGIAGAPVFIAGASIAASTWPDSVAKNALAIALYFGGAGFGIFLTAITIPLVLEASGATAWPSAWLLMGTMSIVATAFSIPLMPKSAKELVSTQAQTNPLPYTRLYASLFGYFCFSAGYIVYMTFVVAWLHDNGASVDLVVMSWGLLGIAVMLSPFPWRPILASFQNGVPLAAATFATAIGSLIPLFLYTWLGFALSAIIFGLSFFIAPAAVTSFSRKNLEKNQWSAAVSLYTTVFAIGQTLGPIGAGFLSDMTGDLTFALMASGLVLITGAGFALLQSSIKA